MFWTVLGNVLTPGLGAALSPMMIVAAIILASAKGGARKAFIFALGDFLALAGVGVGSVLAAGAADISSKSDPSKFGMIVNLVVGILLWFLAWRTYQTRPADGETPPAVQKLNALDQASTMQILGMGFAIGLLNAKNFPLTISVAASLNELNAGTTLAIVGMLVFALLGSLAVLAPGVIVLIAPKDAERVLGAGRDYFVDHNTVIMVVLFIILGASMISKSLGPLFG